MWLLDAVYAALAGALALFGLNTLYLLAQAMRAVPSPQPPPPARWPSVCVQIPLYNERHVAGRAISAACALDYPALHIQILDDSTDDTSALVAVQVAGAQARGVNITHLRRPHRHGYKAGALAEGLRHTTAELIAIFDADFAPAPDFLRQVVPHLCADPRAGAVQTRWEHLNASANLLTRALSVALDGYFATDQTARQAGGLPLNFNGSAGVWRRDCILEAGGWQADTLAEDTDLSYRAWLAGWRVRYVHAITAPADLPTTLTAFTTQQFRWAKGSAQVWRRLGGRIWQAPWPTWHKVQASLHLLGYAPFALAVGLWALLLVMAGLGHTPPAGLAGWGWLGLGPALAALWGQWRVRGSLRGWWAYPAMMLIGVGTLFTPASALWQALTGQASAFVRTPKGHTYQRPRWPWAESAALGLTAGAMALAPGLAVPLLVFALGWGLTLALYGYDGLVGQGLRRPFKQ